MLYIYLLWWDFLTFILSILLIKVISFQFKESLPTPSLLYIDLLAVNSLDFTNQGSSYSHFQLWMVTLLGRELLVGSFVFFIYFMVLALFLFFPELYICHVTALWPISLWLKQFINSSMWFPLYTTVVSPLAVFRILSLSLFFFFF